MLADGKTAIPVRIRLLGGFEFSVGDRALSEAELGRRDSVRLVQYLALVPGRRMHREQVLDALWPDAPFETVANRLHKAAHYLRKATAVSGSVVLASDSVSLFPNAAVDIDVEHFERLARTAGDPDTTTDERAALADEAIRLYQGDLLPHDPYEEWTFHHRQRLQLRYRELLRQRGRYVELLAVDPVDEEAHVGVMRMLLSAGDRAGVRRQYQVLREVLERELGVSPSAEARGVLAAAVDADSVTPVAPVRSRAATLATQRVGFCRTRDGVRLAYGISGTGPPLVKASNWLTHLDHDWDSPVWRHWWEALSADHTLVRYDERGCGLSDWDVDSASFTLDAWVRDLETVVDALGLERFPLLGISQGGPIAITYAVRHPERVSHVIVVGTCARSTWARADEEQRRELTALSELIKSSWGSDRPGFRQIYDAKFLPDGPIELWRAFDELQRRSASPRNAHRLWRAFGSLDCSEAASALTVPTLILHADEDQVWSYEEATDLHARIQGSRLVPLRSNNHILRSDEPAFAVFLDEIARFLAD